MDFGACDANRGNIVKQTLFSDVSIDDKENGVSRCRNSYLCPGMASQSLDCDASQHAVCAQSAYTQAWKCHRAVDN